MNPDTAGQFVFVGASLALDLVNTEVVVRGKRRDLLASQADAFAWWRAARAQHPLAGLSGADVFLDDEDDSLLKGLHELRRSLRAVFSVLIDGETIPDGELAVLNRVLGASAAQVVVDAERPRMSHAARENGLDGLLSPIARSAAELLTGMDLRRLHRCANERCVLLFYDTTKSATRHWCSTGCMDRARSRRRHRQRQRDRNPTPENPEVGSG